MPGSTRSPRSSTATLAGRRPPVGRQLVLAVLVALACLIAGGTTPALAAGPPTPASIGSAAATTTTSSAVAASSSALRCANAWKSAGLSAGTAVTATAVGLAESSCTASATNSNGATSGCPRGSVDRGMWQINGCYHSEVSSACAFNAVCNAQAAFRISSSGTNWRPWSTYNSGAYRSRLADAQSAVNAVFGAGGGGGTTVWPVLRQGATGAKVRTLQYLLRQRGSAIAADGIFGAGTAGAVRSFQSSHGLSADGVVGTNTWSALVVTVRSGSTGQAVRGVQTSLRAHGSSVTVDGIFGSGTASAVRSFQSARGLSADGIVGPNTWRALVS
jgi:hypothetical protein